MAMASGCVWMVYFIENEKILLLHLTSPKLIFTPFPPPLPPSALPLFPIAFSVISLNHYPRAVPTRKPLLSLVLEAPFISSDEFFHLRDKRKEILLCIRKNTVPLVWWYLAMVHHGHWKVSGLHYLNFPVRQSQIHSSTSKAKSNLIKKGNELGV